MATRNLYTNKDDIAMIRHALYKINQNPAIALKGMEAWEDFQQFGSVTRTTSNLCSHFRKAIQGKLEKFRSEFKWEDLYKLYINLQLTPNESSLQRMEDYYGITISTNSDGTLVKPSKIPVGVKGVPRKREIILDDESDSTEVSVSPVRRAPNTPVNFDVTGQIVHIKETANVRCKDLPRTIQHPIATSTPIATKSGSRRLTMNLRNREPASPERKRLKVTCDRVPSPPCNDTDMFPDRQPDIFDTCQDSLSPSPLANAPDTVKHPEASKSVAKEIKPEKSTKFAVPLCPPLKQKPTTQSANLDASRLISLHRRQSLFADVWKIVEDLGINSDDISDLLKKVENEMASKASSEEDYKKCISVVLDGINQSILTFSKPDYDTLTNGNSNLELEEHAQVSTEFRKDLLNKIFDEQIGQLMILQKQFRHYVLQSEQAILNLSNSEKDYESHLIPIVENFKKQLMVPLCRD